MEYFNILGCTESLPQSSLGCNIFYDVKFFMFWTHLGNCAPQGCLVFMKSVSTTNSSSPRNWGPWVFDPDSAMALTPFRSHQQSLLAFMVLLLSPLSAVAQTAPCANGIIRSPKANGQIVLCDIVAQSDPKLTAELGSALKLLGQQQKQINNLVSAVNAVGKNVDPARQTKMLQTLVEKLQSNPGAAPLRAEHLTAELTSLDTDIQSMQSDPTAAALTQAKLEGPLGDAVAQLDVSEAKADLADIRTTLKRIEAQTQHIAITTDATQKGVTSLNKQMNVLMATADPARLLPADEAKLYTEMQPLYMECSSMATRWLQADSAGMRSLSQRLRQERTAVATNPYQQDIDNGIAPLAAQYGKDLQPRLEAWRLKLVQRAPSLSTQPEFKPPVLNSNGNETLMRRAGGQMVRFLRMYPNADPNPSPELIAEGQKLRAELRDCETKIAAVHRAADEANFERRNAAHPATTPAKPAVPNFTEMMNPDVDPPFQKEFATILQPKMQAWLEGAGKLIFLHETPDFSQAINGMTMQQKVCGQFAHAILPFNEKVTADLRAAAAAAR